MHLSTCIQFVRISEKLKKLSENVDQRKNQLFHSFLVYRADTQLQDKVGIWHKQVATMLNYNLYPPFSSRHQQIRIRRFMEVRLLLLDSQKVTNEICICFSKQVLYHKINIYIYKSPLSFLFYSLQRKFSCA